MERDFLFNVMMETTTTMTGVQLIAKFSQSTLVIVEVQKAKIHAQSSNRKSFNFFQLVKPIYMAK